MEAALLAILVAMALAWFNGANDNIKGAVTLVGCGLSSPRQAIVLATAATAAGGLASLWLLSGLLQAFSGRGIVPDALAGSAMFLVPVGLAAAGTVGLATRLGLPISTTHALVGALIGAGWQAAPGASVIMATLAGLALTLILVPLSAVALALLVLPLAGRLRRRSVGRPDPCLCVASEHLPAGGVSTLAQARVVFGDVSQPACASAAEGAVLHWSSLRTLDIAHLLSALAVSFARGLNDTPKIAAIALVGFGSGAAPASLAVVVAMAMGGLVAARRVTETMAWRVTRMDAAEGFGGNLVTSGLVLAASAVGMPVSTTHVSCGALFGLAANNRSGRMRTIVSIALAWLITLPLAAALGMMFFFLTDRIWQ